MLPEPANLGVGEHIRTLLFIVRRRGRNRDTVGANRQDTIDNFLCGYRAKDSHLLWLPIRAFVLQVISTSALIWLENTSEA